MTDKLDTYRRKRDFETTPEPAGSPVQGTGERRFVVQRHRASRLHYDFRLEIDGVLVSWAVPKGPTLDPNVRRGAFRTEDHPIEYLLFEGVIPAREYGGGDVTVWDTGTWQPDDEKPDASRGLARGELHVDLFGQKLRGRFVLIRTGPPGDKEQWLLLHKHDEFAVPGYDAEDHPASALSGRTNDEVQADPDRLWRSDLPAAEASVELKPSSLSPDVMAELDAFGAGGTWHVYDRAIRLSNLDREIVGGRGAVTKRDLVRYAAQIAPVAGAHLDGREFLVSGVARAPEWIELRHRHIVVSEPAALIWAANFGAVEWRLEPTRSVAVIELDPPTRVRWTDVLVVARLYRTALEHLGVVARPMLTGTRALTIWVPTDGSPPKNWTQTLTESVAAVVPDEIGRAWQVGDAAEQVLAPYSPRELARAPVAVPLEWDELDDPKLRAAPWTIRTVLDRLAGQPDPFRALVRNKQRLPRWQ